MRSFLYFIVILLYFFLFSPIFSVDTIDQITLEVNEKNIMRKDRVRLYGFITPALENIPIIIRRKYKGQSKYHKIAKIFSGKDGAYQYFAKIKKKAVFKAIVRNIGKNIKSTKVSVTTSSFNNCGSNNDLFSVSPIDISRIQSIRPLGNMSPSGHTFPTRHIYFNLTPNGENTYDSTSLFSPGDIKIISMTSSTNLTKSTTDYGINFQVCNQFRGYFLHIKTLSSNLLELFQNQTGNCSEYESGGELYQHCLKDFDYDIQAGELLGTVGEGNNGTFDMGAYDTRIDPLIFANSLRYTKFFIYNVCPLDYFTNSLKSQLHSLLGYSEIRRTEEPICGSINHDVIDTAQGNWFISGSPIFDWVEDQQLTLAHDNVQPQYGVFSMGTSGNSLSVGRYFFNPVHSGYVNRDFDEVQADEQTYCYEVSSWPDGSLSPFIILIQLINNTQLRIEKQNSTSCGSGPWIFGSGSADYER